MPRVSVVIPTYNRPQFLGDCLKSILAQTFQDFEVLVIQNGNRSDSRFVVDSFILQDAPIQYFEIKEANPSAARNFGIQRAKGEYVAFMDDDDMWHPEKLKKQVDYLDANSEVGMVACRALLCDQLGKIGAVRGAVFEQYDLSRLISEDLWNLVPSLSSVVVRRKCFAAVGEFDRRYFYANDLDFYLRLAEKYNFYVISEPLFYFRRHEMTLSSNIAIGHGETVKVLMAFSRAAKSSGYQEAIKRSVIRNCQHIYFEAYDVWKKGNTKLAWRKFATVLSLDPWIGAKISWSKFSNPAYKIARPYLLLIHSLIANLWGRP